MYKHLLSFLISFSFLQKINAQNIDVQATSIPQAQTRSIESLGSYIKQNFTTDTARVRAIYVWIADNVSYDLQRLQDMESNPNHPQQKVEDVLKTKKAVCQGYSELFVALCKNIGIDAMVISGYTKQQGKISPISHAWVAALLNNDWYLFDPTWGAGFLRDNNYVKKFNNNFYKVSPATMVLDHMPFDPIFQFISNPISHREFINGNIEGSKPVFSYKDSLIQYNQLSKAQQMADELRRLEAAGIQNHLLLKRKVYLKNSLQNFASKDAFEEGGKAFNSAMTIYKEYVGHKNKQFDTLNDNDLKQMVDSMFQYVKLSRSLLIEAVPKTDEQRQAKAGNITNLDRFYTQLNKEKQFVDEYIGADANKRKQMFMIRK